jgi:hypothetical protein
MVGGKMKKIIITGIRGSRSTILAQLIMRGLNIDGGAEVRIDMELRRNIKELLEDKNTTVILTMCHPKRAFAYPEITVGEWTIAAENFEYFKKHQRVIPIRAETLMLYPNVVQNHLIDKLKCEKEKSFELIMRKEKLDLKEIRGKVREWKDMEEMLEHPNVRMLIKRLDYE